MTRVLVFLLLATTALACKEDSPCPAGQQIEKGYCRSGREFRHERRCPRRRRPRGRRSRPHIGGRWRRCDFRQGLHRPSRVRWGRELLRASARGSGWLLHSTRLRHQAADLPGGMVLFQRRRLQTRRTVRLPAPLACAPQRNAISASFLGAIERLIRPQQDLG